jgi:signal transduction histidine kinase
VTPDGPSKRAPRAASAGLAAVVLCLGGFSLFAAYSTQTRVEQVQRSELLSDSYGRATAAIRSEETAELEYLFDPTAEHLTALGQANESLITAVNEIAGLGDRADEELAKNILALHDQYLVASERLLGVMSAGNLTDARRIDHDVADPIFHSMQVLVTAATLEHQAAAEAAFAALLRTARWLLVAAPVVFAIGFALLIVLWRILNRYDSATRKTYREIEQLSRLRGEFVATVSHEFRTPLMGIQGFSEMMRDEQLTPDEVREYAGDINKDAQRLARLITDMLDLDQMESGGVTLNVQPVDLNAIIVETAALFRLSAARAIELRLDELLPKLAGDAERLAQVVTNLLSNAIKYSPRGGDVELRTARDGQAVVFTVADHGIGIPAQLLEKIFERYAQTTTTTTRALQGTGLGLPIVRQIVQLHRGTVWATSESGVGSVFHVRLPLPESTPVA